MKRRAFIAGVGASAAALAWPLWLREAFADPCDVDPKKPGERDAVSAAALVTGAFRRAKKSGRALLVLVIPASDGARYERGRVFGELLNHGLNADLAPLATVEVVCATMTELALVVPTDLSVEPLMVLVEPSRVPATAIPLDVTLPSYADAPGTDWQVREKAETAVALRRIELLGALLRKHLGGSGRDTETRAEEVRERLVKKPPPGTHWANASGCGTQIEGVEQNYAIGCGMGHVPEKSRRFLYFFTPGSRLF